MQSLSHSEKIAILKCLAWIATKDDVISKPEISFLENIALQMKIDPLPSIDTLNRNHDLNQNLKQLKSKESQQKLLELLINMSFIDGVYDAREREAVVRVANLLGRSTIDVDEIEHQLAESFRQKLAKASQEEKKCNSTEWDLGKVATIAGAAVAGGLVLAATGGLAAPLIGGAIGTTFFGLSGAAATSAGLAFLGGGSLAAGGLGMAGGTTLVTAAMGACGVGVAGWKANHLLGDIKEWDIKHIGGESLQICLGISGFLQQKESAVNVWSSLMQQRPYSCNYSLVWESKTQQDLYNVLSGLAQQGLIGGLIAKACLSATRNAFGLLVLPMTVLSALQIIDHPWAVAKNRAEQAGKLLGDYIAESQFGGLPVTLVGYSLGSRVIVAALDRLAELNALGKIDDVYFLGGAVSQADPRLEKAKHVISGSIVNVYSKNDVVLTYIYRAAEFLEQPIGIRSMDLEGVINIDVTQTVSGHLNYMNSLSTIMALINEKLGRAVNR